MRQGVVQAAVNKIVHIATIAKTYFVFGRMHIDVDVARVEFEIQYKSRMPAVIQHIGIGLPNSVTDQFVANSAAIDVKMLQI